MPPETPASTSPSEEDAGFMWPISSQVQGPVADRLRSLLEELPEPLRSLGLDGLIGRHQLLGPEPHAPTPVLVVGAALSAGAPAAQAYWPAAAMELLLRAADVLDDLADADQPSIGTPTSGVALTAAAGLVAVASASVGRCVEDGAAVFSAWVGINFVLALTSLGSRMRRAGDRVNLAPLLVGVAVGTLPLIGLFVIPTILQEPRPIPVEFVAVALVAIPASFAYAIIRHRLFALDAVLRRQAMLLVTALVVALLFSICLGLVYLLGLPLEVTSLVAGVAIALATPALRGRIAGTIDAWLFPPLLHARDVLAPEATAADDLVRNVVVRHRELLPIR